MKKFLVVLVLLGAAGAYAYKSGVLSSPSKRACNKLAELCGENSPSEINECIAEFDEFDKKGSVNFSEDVADCTADATTCAEAIGCTAKAGVNAFGTLGDQFFKGFNKK